MVTPAILGTALERRRLKLGLSREALGASAGGISAATIKRAERELVKPHPSTLAALTAALERAEVQRNHDPEANRAVEKAGRGGGQRPV
jgi:predicted transcriptional regulator